MKLLKRKLNKSNTPNGLEKLLYTDIETTVEDTKHVGTTKPYERGMMITVSNNKTHWESMQKQYRNQYLTLLYALTGQNKYSRYDIKSVDGIEEKVAKKIYNYFHE